MDCGLLKKKMVDLLDPIQRLIDKHVLQLFQDFCKALHRDKQEVDSPNPRYVIIQML